MYHRSASAELAILCTFSPIVAYPTIINGVAYSFLLPPAPDVISRTRWYVFIRWFLLAAIAIPSALTLHANQLWSTESWGNAPLAVTAIVSNCIFYLCTRLPKPLPYFQKIAGIIIATDIALVTALIFVDGGIESRAIILYALPILATATIFGRRHIFLTTGIVIAIYCLLVCGDYLGILQTGGSYNPDIHQNRSYVINSVLMFSSTLLVIGAMIDFMMRVLVEQERYARETLGAMKLAQSIAKLGSWEWDIAKDKMAWSNEFYNVIGAQPGLATPSYQTLVSLVVAEDRILVERQLKKALKRKQQFSFDYRVRDPDGSVRYVHTDGQSIADKSGKIIKLFGTAQDITDAKLLEEARSDFVSLASHQLRTPATGVKQYLKMLQEGYAGSLTPAQDRLLQTAYESNERQLDIIDDLLQVAQIDSGKITLRFGPVDVIALLHDIVKEQELEFRAKEQHVVIHSRHQHLICQADEQRLRMALENIIENARKYTPISKRVTIRITKSSGSVQIRITDQGVGIAQNDMKRLFQKFSRIDSALTPMVGGSGLGLYWAARIISLHNGTIDVSSIIGKGTTFTIAVPIAKR